MKEKLSKKEINLLKGLGVKFIDKKPFLNGFPVDDDTLNELIYNKNRNKTNKQRKR